MWVLEHSSSIYQPQIAATIGNFIAVVVRAYPFSNCPVGKNAIAPTPTGMDEVDRGYGRPHQDGDLTKYFVGKAVKVPCVAATVVKRRGIGGDYT